MSSLTVDEKPPWLNPFIASEFPSGSAPADLFSKSGEGKAEPVHLSGGSSNELAAPLFDGMFDGEADPLNLAPPGSHGDEKLSQLAAPDQSVTGGPFDWLADSSTAAPLDLAAAAGTADKAATEATPAVLDTLLGAQGEQPGANSDFVNVSAAVNEPASSGGADPRTEKRKADLTRICRGKLPPYGAAPDYTLEHGPLGHYAENIWGNPGVLPVTDPKKTVKDKRTSAPNEHQENIADPVVRPKDTGKYPRELFRVPGNERLAYLREDAAKAFLRMREAAKKAGVDLQIESGFRDQSGQVKNWKNGFNTTMHLCAGLYKNQQDVVHRTAHRNAVPGFSNHGGGLAVDLRTKHGIEMAMSDATRQDCPVYKWLEKNAARFGFVNYLPSGQGKDRNPGEAWHWEYSPQKQMIAQRLKRMTNDVAKAPMDSKESAQQVWSQLRAAEEYRDTLEGMKPGDKQMGEIDAELSAAWARVYF